MEQLLKSMYHKYKYIPLCNFQYAYLYLNNRYSSKVHIHEGHGLCYDNSKRCSDGDKIDPTVKIIFMDKLIDKKLG